MKSFLEWDLKVLAPIVNWFDKARGYAQNIEANIDERNLSAIYQFATRALPLMFVTHPKQEGKCQKKDLWSQLINNMYLC
mmetsp:Transcript_13345/g.21711  ORF Transcript_13345/g.21711 Transcript_13345/m.21711 type:complete len:80 (-) Transcript_13345:300-539(-)